MNSINDLKIGDTFWVEYDDRFIEWGVRGAPGTVVICPTGKYRPKPQLVTLWAKIKRLFKQL